MLESTISARNYFFVCNFMWDNLLLFHYLDEEVSPKRINSVYFFKWSSPFEDLANWCLEERFFPIDLGEITINEKDLLLTTAEKLGESLVFELGNQLSEVATKMYKKFPVIIESMWLYYCYCRFLQKTLIQFKHVLQMPGSSSVYYQRYHANLDVFDAMNIALEHESSFLDNQEEIDKKIRESIWKDMDNYVSKLGVKWRMTVLFAARNLKLPDFGSESF